MRRATLALGVILVFSSPRPGRAQEASVDRILSSLAEVIETRARLASSQKTRDQLKARLCRGSLVLDSGLTLRLGGSDPDNPDHAFVRSCRLLREDGLGLADPHFLKKLSREAVELLLRVTARKLGSAEYRERGLFALARYVHRSMEALEIDRNNLFSLAEPTRELARALSRKLPEKLSAELAGKPATKKLFTETQRWLDEQCPATPPSPGRAAATRADGAQKNPPGPTSVVCEEWRRNKAVWRPHVASGGTVDGPACLAYSSARAQFARNKLREQLFTGSGKPGAMPAKFAHAEEAPCTRPRGDGTRLKGADLAECRRARVLVHLYDRLYRFACQKMHKTASDIRANLRQTTYVLLQREVYRDAFTSTGSGGADHALKQFFNTATELQLDELPWEQLAYGVRLLGTLLAAYRDDRPGTERWLGKLYRDLSIDVGYPDLLDVGALATSKRPRSPPVAALRDAIKDMLTLPSLQLTQNFRPLQAATTAQDGAVALVRRVAALSQRKTAAKDIIVLIPDVFTALARVSRSFAALAASEAKRGPEARRRRSSELSERSRASAEALEQTAKVLAFASRRDWVALALDLSSLVREHAESRRAMTQSLRFIRVLLSMYQADTVDEAKGIFQAFLDDETGRARRYDGFAVDLVALFAARGGLQLTYRADDGADPAWHDSPFGGIYAPIGVQMSRGKIGLLFYPLDLGSYLTASDQPPAWPDAVRAGLALYLRPWRNTPIVFGVAGDWRPRFAAEIPRQARAFATMALELPLYLIH